jgi:hypothetical protein
MKRKYEIKGSGRSSRTAVLNLGYASSSKV